MRLVRIKPLNFRGFSCSDWINTDSSLVVVYGPNGYGKTSLAEAIEWLLYGKTKRREKGENFSKRDYQGSYINIHAEEGSQTIVEAEFRLQDNTLLNLKRELVIVKNNIESSITFIDGNSADFSSIGIIQEEIFYPIIAQHSLQDFIHTRPKDRRDKISEALGLDALVKFKSIVERGRIRFQNNPNEVVNIAKVNILNVIETIKQSTSMSQITDRWESSDFNFEKDSREIIKLANIIMGEEIEYINEPEYLMEELTGLKSEISSRVFKMNTIRFKRDFEVILEKLELQKLNCTEFINGLTTKLDNYFASIVDTLYTFEQIGLWETGFKIWDCKTDLCPLCENNTFIASKRKELEGRINDAKKYKGALIELEDHSKLFNQEIKQLINMLQESLPTFLEEQDYNILMDLFKESPDKCQTFLQVHDSIKNFFDQSLVELNKTETSLQSLHILVRDPEKVKNIRETVVSIGENIRNFYNVAKDKIIVYVEAYNLFEPILISRISSEDAIKDIDSVISSLSNLNHIAVLSEYNKLLDSSLNLIRDIEEYIKLKQSQIFITRGQEINDWYDMMNPEASVRYSRMESGTDSITLWAQSFGVDMNAVSCLSQCQLNCLGLSVSLMKVTTPGTPYSFLIMDDPVQSMDDNHCQSLILFVINNLLRDRDKQLIVFSHLQGVTDSIRDLYYDIQPIRLRISDFNIEEGPVIELDESLKHALDRAKRLARGNEENRRLSVKVVRRCVELLIREICRKTNSNSPPDNETATNMIRYFQACPDTTPQQTQGLQITINFSNPGPHTQVGWAVPTQSQIEPHIQRLQQMGKVLHLFN